MSHLPVTQTPAVSEGYPSRRLLGRLAVAIAGLGLLKFLGLLIEAGPTQAPWGFLLVVVAPFLIGRILLSAYPRIGAVVVGVMATAAATLSGAVLIQGSLEPYWGDYLLVFIGGPLSLVAIVAAIRVLRGH